MISIAVVPGGDMKSLAVRLERDDAVAFIVVDNPPVNAGSWEVRFGLLNAIEEIAADRAVIGAVLIGAGTSFISGSDIKEFEKSLRDPQVPRSSRHWRLVPSRLYRRECEILLEDGAYPEEIDAALEALGFAMGPFAVSDMSGLDIAWRTRKRLAARRDPRERYVDILDRLCEAGRLGRKTKAGWYVYHADGKRGEADAAVAAIIDNASRARGIRRRSFTLEELQQRARVPCSTRLRSCCKMALRSGHPTSIWCWSTAMAFRRSVAALCSGPAGRSAR